MPVLQILSLLVFMGAIPLAIGAGATAFIKKQERNVCFMWIAGYLIMFALFQLIAIPLIVKLQTLTLLVWIYGAAILAAAVAGFGIWFVKVGKTKPLKPVEEKECDKISVALWILFALLLLVQLFGAAFLAFGDGDDAFYVATSTVADNSDAMYRILPYTGGSSGWQNRHVWAPMPIFISFLARVTGLHTATLSHIAMPVFLIPATYCIYGLLANFLFKGKKRWVALFLVFASIIVMWSNYSIYTAETFLLTRTRQGKAAVGNLVIPALFLLMFMLAERLAEKRKVEKTLWMLVFATVMTACLCSTMGGFLSTVLLGIIGFCMLVAYKRWTLLLPFFISIIPAVVYSALYVLFRQMGV